MGVGLAVLGRPGLALWSWHKARPKTSDDATGGDIATIAGQEQDLDGDADQPADPIVLSLQEALREQQEQLSLAKQQWEEQQQQKEVSEVALQQAEEALHNMHRDGKGAVDKVEAMAVKFMDERDLYK